MAKNNPRTGSSLDDFLKEQGMYEEITEKARKRAISDVSKEDSLDAGYQAMAADLAREAEAILEKGRQVLDSTREEFYVKAKAAKSKLGNDHGGVLAGPVKRNLPTVDKVR